MEFKNFVQAIQKQFAEMTKDVSHLFEVEVDQDELWSLYLNSYLKGTNEIFRKRREYDCSCCRNFIKNIGNMVTIKNGVVSTLWDISLGDDKFQVVANALSKYIQEHTVVDVYFSKTKRVGIPENFERLENGEIIKWEHFFIDVPSQFVLPHGHSAGDIKGSYRDTKNVFKRSLDEITSDSVETVLELISQNSLYKGKEWQSALITFLDYKKKYDTLTDSVEKDLFAWEQSVIAGAVIGRIRNHSIGLLLVNISEGMELDAAVRKYEAIVAPSNYKRPKAIYTKKMLKDAQKTVTELGYMESLPRRFAKLDDITVNNILFSNRDSAKRIVGANVFEEMSKEVAINPKKFSKVDTIAIDDFLLNVLPTASELEILLENRHSAHFVSLIAPINKDSKTMFKWNNPFSWAYAGNITDSSMKENVKMAGGNVDGVLRFSIQWNDEDYNPNDFDAHCIEPNLNEICYHCTTSSTSGALDVDIVNPIKNKAAVENIVWTNTDKMPIGTYKFFVNCFSNRGGKSGFKAEVEFNGQIYQFNYSKALRYNENVQVAEVYWDGTNFTLQEKLPSSASSREIWNLKTNQFVPVSVVMYSPNYWNEQQGIGHKHYFFMLKNCINSEKPNGFYNEFLKNELTQHKRVFEALGNKMAVQDVEDQLSGLGFSSTKHNNLLVKVKGKTERIMKIEF